MKVQFVKKILSTVICSALALTLASSTFTSLAASVAITGNETVSSGLEGSQMAILYDSSIGMPTSRLWVLTP